MSRNQVVAGETEKDEAARRLQTVAYIAELLLEMEGLVRRDGINELEMFLRDAREAAQKLAGQR